MGGKLTKNNRIPLQVASEVSEEMLDTLQKYTEVGIVAGSIRRAKPEVGDIDLVVIPSSPRIFDILDSLGFGGGDKKRVGLFHNAQVDVFLATAKNFGAQCLMWTGSAQFNIKMRAKAKRREWRLNQYGLFAKDGRRIAGTEEANIFAALNMRYIQPEDRD